MYESWEFGLYLQLQEGNFVWKGQGTSHFN